MAIIYVAKEEKIMQRTIIFSCITAIPVFIIAFVCNDLINDYLLSFFDNNAFIFQQTTVSNFGRLVRLNLSIALIPVFILLTWRYGQIDSPIKKLLSLWLIGICISSGLTVNTFRILSAQMVMTNFKGKTVYPVEALHFDYAIILGTIVGCVIALLIFKSKKTAKAA
jgi:hypothetical protein